MQVLRLCIFLKIKLCMLDKARSDYFYSFLPVCAAALVLAAQARACVFEIRMSARENCSVLSENARERTRSKFLRFFFWFNPLSFTFILKEKLVKQYCC